jgi:hypothetical protein
MIPEQPSLSSANTRVAALLTRLDDSARSTVSLTKDMSALMPALHIAAVAVHGEAQPAQDLAEYKRILLQLQALLPRIHARLVLESDHVRNQGAHREAAAAWIAASRITF